MPSDGIFETRPDYYGLFALVVGLYAAAVVAPAATLLLAAGTAHWQVYATLLGNAALVTVLVGVAATRVEESLALRLGRTRLSRGLPLAWGLPLAGVPYAGWLAAARPGGVSVWLSMAGIVGGFLLGLVVLLMARNRAVRDRIADAQVLARWSAKAAPRRRRLAKRLAVASLGVGIAAIAAGAALGVQPLTWTGQVLAPAGPGLFGATEHREYAALEEGLVVRAPATVRVVPWDRFEGFDETGDALVLHRREPWRLAISCDASEIEDVAGVREALAAFVPKSERTS